MGAMARAQPTLQRPEGLVLDQTFLSEEEERELLARIESLDFRAVVMRGAVARRTVRGYGWKYGFENASVEPAEPLPDWLIPVRDRAAYVLGGPARSIWEHRIPPVKELRYSLTFRSLRRRA